MSRIAVCLAAFNRRETTLRCLDSLFQAPLPHGAALTVYLLDDASPDGTAEAVARRFPAVRLLHGDGAHYWSGGMRVAYGAALADGHDAYLWLNDDVVLEPDAIVRALAVMDEVGGKGLVVGSMRCPESGATTYGGRRKPGRGWPWRFELVAPEPDRTIAADTVNGNFLLIPAAVAQRLGNIPRGYVHSGADFDYGLRARKADFGCWIMPGHAGACRLNLLGQRWADPAQPLTLLQRLRLLEQPLGFPLSLRRTYWGAHFPLWAPLILIKPYIDILSIALGCRPSRLA